MQTSLDFLNIGESWPPLDERERLNVYAQNKKLFEGKHDEVFSNWIKILRNDQQATLELILNWHKRLSVLWADLLLGEPPDITAGEDKIQQESLQRIMDSNDFLNTCYEVVLDISRYGTGIFKIRFDGRGIIEGQPPSVWFPVVKPDNIKEFTAHVLAWSYREGEREYLRCEIHEKGLITTRTYVLGNGEIRGLMEEEVQETGVDDFLVIPVNNIVTTDRITGLDDYTDLDTIIQELETRIAQISRILDKHADPNMYGPDSALIVDPDSGQASFSAGGSYFPVSPGDVPPGYVTWDGQLDASFRQIDLLLQQLYIMSETSAAAFGQLKSGLAESGSALKRLMMAPLAKTNRVRLRFDPAIKRALKLASLLEKAQGMQGAIEVEQVHIDWQDGLPDDPAEETGIETARYTTGLSSLESSLRRLDGLTGDALEEEVQRIKAGGVQDPETPRITLPESIDEAGRADEE